MLLVVGALNGCAMHGAPPKAGAVSSERSDMNGRNVVTVWQMQLADYMASAGSSDPAVLSQLPTLRSQAVARPGQILFVATDVEAFVPERDGFDVVGLLLGKQTTATGPRYVFVVGTIERRDYWPVAVTDVRVVAMGVKDGIATWETGAADTQALRRYRSSSETSTMVRFPADQDQFRLSDCEPGICVEERRSGARWALYSDTPVASAPAAR